MITVAFVEVRRDGARLPNKQMEMIGDRPLCWHAMSHALRSELIDEVVLSTNCPQASEVARSLSIEVMTRTEEMCREDMPLREWLPKMDGLYLDWCRRRWDFSGGELAVCRVMGNSLIIDDSLHDRGLSLLVSTASEVRSVTFHEDTHPDQSVLFDVSPDNGRMSLFNGGAEFGQFRSTKYRPAYYIDSGVCAYHLPRVKGPVCGVVSRKHSVFHVHDSLDLELARAAWDHSPAMSLMEEVAV